MGNRGCVLVLRRQSMLNTRDSNTFMSVNTRKARGTGGTNDLFSKHIDIPTHSPEPHARYQHQSWTYVKQVACHKLKTFSHYMSAYLIIIKPPQMSDEQKAFLDQHRQWLSIRTKSTEFKPMVWDKVKKRMVDNVLPLYLETKDYMAIPRFYALALYGPDVWQTHVVNVDAKIHKLTKEARLMHHWSSHYGMTQVDGQTQVDQRPMASLTCPIMQMVQREFASVTPPWIMSLADRQRQQTGLLTFRGSLRTQPVNQAQLICKIIRQWQLGRVGPPGMIASAATGLGKTLMAMVAWMFMDLQFDDQRRDEDVLVEQLNQPRSTGRGLFIVHGIELMEQAMESIEQTIDGIRIGIIQGNRRADPEQCDIVIASTDTIAAQNFPPSYWRHFRLVMMDEAHQNTAKQYQRAVSKIAVPLTLAFTATPREWSLPWIMGPIVFYVERPHMEQCVNMILNKSSKIPHQVEYDKDEKPDFHKMATKLVGDLHRSTWISQLAIDQVYPQLASHHNFRLIKRQNFWDQNATSKPSMSTVDKPSSTSSQHASKKRQLTIAEALGQSSDAQPPAAKRIKSSEPTRADDAQDDLLHQLMSSSRQMHIHESTGAPSKVISNATTHHRSTSTTSNVSISSPATIRHIPVVNDSKKLVRRTLMLSISVQHLIMMQHLVAQAYMDLTGQPDRYMIVRTHLRQIAVVDRQRMTDDHWACIVSSKWPRDRPVPRFDAKFFHQWFEAHPQHAPEKTLNFDDRLCKDGAADAMHEDMYTWTPIYGPIPGVAKSKVKPTTQDKLNDKFLWKPVVMEHDDRPALPIMTTVGLLVGLNYTVGKHPDHACGQEKHTCKRLGRLTRIEKQIAKHSQFVMATWQIASVGMDEPGLDTLWELTPRSDVQQADGRIQRIMPDKQLITKNEMVESWSSPYNNMAMLHLEYYKLERRKVYHYAIDANHSRLVIPHQ